MSMRDRLIGLDCLRGLAAIAVVIFHYGQRYAEIYNVPTPAWMEVFDIGRYGVFLFFLISGYVIFFSVSQGDHKTSNWKTFLKKRIIRLYPAYWAALVFTFVLVQVFGLPGREVDFLAFLANFSMLQYFFGVTSVDGVYWTLAVEWCFYIVILILLLTNSVKYFEVVILLFGIAGLGLLIVADLVPMIDKVGFLYKCFCFFFIGAVIYYFRNSKWIAFLNVGVIFLFLQLISNASDIVYDIIVLCVFTTGIVPLGVWSRLKPLIWLGQISYPLYLLHQNVGYVIFYNLNVGDKYIYLIFPVIAFMLVLSYLLNVFVEKPFQQVLRQRFL